MATTKSKSDSGDDRDDGVVSVSVKDADGNTRVHYTAKGSAAERDLTAKADKGNKGDNDATPSVAAG